LLTKTNWTCSAHQMTGFFPNEMTVSCMHQPIRS
jgi:hypothetical protein